MLTPGVSVKNVSFRREGFRKWESMNRKKTKNLLVLMVLSSAAAAGYLVFYNHEPGERELVDEMHIDGALDGEQEIVHAHHHHHHRVDEDDDDEPVVRNKDGKMIGQKLFLHGVNKDGVDVDKAARVKSLAERLKERLAERRKQQAQEEEEEEDEKEEAIGVGMGKGAVNLEGRGAVNLEEKEEPEPVAEKKAESIDSLREKLKLRLQERKRLMAEAKGELVESKKSEDEEEVVEKKKVAEVEGGGKVQSLIERLKARLAEQRKDQEEKEEKINVFTRVTSKMLAAKDDDPFGPDESESENVESKKSQKSDDDDPFGPGGDGESEVKSVKNLDLSKKENSHLRNIADIIYEKKYGVKRPKKEEDEEHLIEPFDEKSFNRKAKNDDGDSPMIKPVARPAAFGDPLDNKDERMRQHIQDLNRVGPADAADMPRRDDHGMEAFQRKQPPKKAFGGFDSGRKFDRNPFMKKKFNAFDARKNINDANAFNKKKESGFGAFKGGQQRESIDDVVNQQKKNDGFGAFRVGGREFDGDSEGLGGMEKAPVKKENQFINEKGLLKGGGGNPVIRPFGNNGMNPFLDHGFEAGGKAKNKAPIPMVGDNDGRKIHFDFRNLDKNKKNKGLLIDEDEGEEHKRFPVPQQALPPRAPEGGMGHANVFGEVPVAPPKRFDGAMGHGAMGHANQFGEVPVAPPRRFDGAGDSAGQANAIGGIPGLNQVPILHPDQLKQRMKEVPVAPPLRMLDQVPKAQSSGGRIHVHDLSKETTYSKATCQRYIYPAPVGSGKICIHKSNMDLVSDTIMSQGSWEHQMAIELVSILNSDWKLGLIDIGAGIGMFSLCAALMHRNVVAIEPFYANYMALHKGADENGVGQRITLITQALDGSSYTGRLSLASRDEGGYSSVHISKYEEGEVVEKKRAVSVTTLDNLGEQAASLGERIFAEKNVIKLDVTDNKEASILEAGRNFLKSADVHYILTHWRKSRAESDHMRLMTAMAKLSFQPKLTYNGDVLEMDNLQMDQKYIVWVRVHTMGEI